MGMPVTVEVIGSGKRVEAAIRRAFDWFDEVDETFSTYKPVSVISRMNRGELSLADAPAEVREVLAACAEMKQRTEGFFDTQRDGQIAPLGYVKGWAIAEAARELERAGFGRYCVEAGGDLQVLGSNASGEPWRVGIRHPSEPGKIVKVVALSDGALATSGNYERGEHIYNPHTGRAANEVLSVTVVGPDIIWADVVATAAFAMGKSGIEFIARQGLEGYQIGKDGVAVFTPGMQKLFQ